MRVSTMTSGLALALALAAPALVAAAPGGPATPAAAAASTASVTGTPLVQINTGRGRLVTLARPMSDLFVADDNVADVQVRSPTQLYIFGKKSGETTVSATTKGGQVVYAATVRVGQNLDSIGSMLGLAMPEARIIATPMNGLVLLTGTVAAPQDAAEAERLVQAYVGEGTKVLSRLRTATPLQVNLQVRFAEVRRSFAKNIGVNMTSIDSTSGFKFGIGGSRSAASYFTTDRGLPLGVGTAVQGYGIDPTSIKYLPGGGIDESALKIIQKAGTNVTPGAERTTLGALTKVFGLDLLSAIDLGETTGQVSILANPNLTALSGETGTFLAGGEVPIPLSQGLGSISVEYKQYGVSLSYTPTVLSDGRISLRVRPEVSQLDYSNAITMGGTRVPGLTTRRAETTLELGSGQSMMIGGLLQNQQANNFDKTPGIGDVPVLGALFRSNAWQRNESELVIVITPYLVKPVDNQSDIALPTDGMKAPTDFERVFGGQLGGGTTGERRPVPTLATPGVPVAAGAAAPARPVPAADKRRDEKAPNTSRKGAPIVAPGFSN